MLVVFSCFFVMARWCHSNASADDIDAQAVKR